MVSSTGWRSAGEVRLQDEAEKVLGEAVCEWAGLKLRPIEVQQRTREFVAMIEGAGAAGPRNWHAQKLRRANERWARSVIEASRAGHIKAPDDSALALVGPHAGAPYRMPPEGLPPGAIKLRLVPELLLELREALAHLHRHRSASLPVRGRYVAPWRWVVGPGCGTAVPPRGRARACITAETRRLVHEIRR